jgi:hypothetical protein
MTDVAKGGSLSRLVAVGLLLGACGGAPRAQARSEREIRLSVRGDGRVVSTPKGIACPPTCRASFLRGASVLLRAEPEGRQASVKWSAPCDRGQVCTLNVGEDRRIEVDFRADPNRLEGLHCAGFMQVQLVRGRSNSHRALVSLSCPGALSTASGFELAAGSWVLEFDVRTGEVVWSHQISTSMRVSDAVPGAPDGWYLLGELSGSGWLGTQELRADQNMLRGTSGLSAFVARVGLDGTSNWIDVISAERGIGCSSRIA